MKLIEGKEQEYKEWYDKNRDAYGRACFTYAERWADLMEAEIEKSDDIAKCFEEKANETSHKADTEYITGYMYGCAVAILSKCWEYGEYLRKWHNKKYGYDGDGAVNPAIMRIG